MLKHRSLQLSLSSSRALLQLSLSLTSPPFSLSPRPQDLPFQVDSKAKGTPIDVENHPFHSFLLGVASFQLEKVHKLGLNGMIVLGCFK